MPAIPAFYFSVLSRQLAFSEELFLKRYANCWLVWEAGGTPGHLTDVSLSVLDTALAGTRRKTLQPGAGDSLCFLLRAADYGPLRIGRALTNELVIAEPTVSRLHAQLEYGDDAWQLVPLSENRKTLVRGKVADPRECVPLTSGSAIELGGVKLSFYDPKGFKTLVAGLPLRSSR